jgi:hypothetical protein
MRRLLIVSSLVACVVSFAPIPSVAQDVESCRLMAGLKPRPAYSGLRVQLYAYGGRGFSPAARRLRISKRRAPANART